MTLETIVIVGMGEIGEALYTVFQEKAQHNYKIYCADLIEEKYARNKGLIPSHVDFMHICIPCVEKDDFIASVLMWHGMLNPTLTIINSTVQPGTTVEIWKLGVRNIVHSPVRGRHSDGHDLVRDIKFWTKYVGGEPEACLQAEAHFKKLGLKTQILGSSTETELAKLFSTTYPALMIAFFQEAHRISKAYDADITRTMEMTCDDHRVEGNKPPFYPDVIGGHCLIPNVELLNCGLDSPMLNAILQSNILRVGELEDSEFRVEVEKVKEKIKNENH